MGDRAFSNFRRRGGGEGGLKCSCGPSWMGMDILWNHLISFPNNYEKHHDSYTKTIGGGVEDCEHVQISSAPLLDF